jgi:tetratricopeptide (TPR) repeat protein
MTSHTFDLDFVLRIKNKLEMKNILSSIFSEISKTEKYDERQVTIVQLVDIFSLNTNLTKYHISNKEFRDLIFESGFIESISKILKISDVGHRDFDAIHYYSITVLSMFIKKDNDEILDLLDEDSLVYFDILDEMFKHGATESLIRIFIGEKKSFVENLKNTICLRFMMKHKPTADLFIKLGGIQKCFDIFKNSKNFLDEEFKKGFKDYQISVLSLGVAGTEINDNVPFYRMTDELAHKRSLYRIPALEENCSMILAKLASFNESKKEFIKLEIVQYSMEYLKHVCQTDVKEDVCASFLCLLSNWTRNEKNIEEILNSKLLYLLDSWMCLPFDFLQLPRSIEIVKNVISYSDQHKKMFLEEYPETLEIICNSVTTPIPSLKVLILQFLLLLAKDKTSCQSLAKISNPFLYELLIGAPKNVEILVNQILMCFKDHLGRKIEDTKNITSLKEKLRGGKKIDHSKAMDFKNKGNSAYQNKEYDKAIELYRKGVMTLRYRDPMSPLNTLHGNICQCYLDLKQYKEALIEGVLSFNAGFHESQENLRTKCIIRLANAFVGLERYREALRCYYHILHDYPNQTSVIESIIEIQGKVKSPHICTYCQSYKKEMLRCSKCLDSYCSRNCQLNDWKEHKIVCRKK